jgi:hypothetical protein
MLSKEKLFPFRFGRTLVHRRSIADDCGRGIGRNCRKVKETGRNLVAAYLSVVAQIKQAWEPGGTGVLGRVLIVLATSLARDVVLYQFK